MRAALLLACLATAGCSMFTGGPTSFVSPEIEQADAPALAEGVAGFVSLRHQPSAGPVAVDGPASDTVLAPEIEAALRRAGYTVAPGGAHRLTYQVDPRSDGALVRIALDGTRAARPYARRNGTLVAAGPYAVAEAAR